ncbi:glycoside hydrolase family 89 protein [Saccharata proteae CBS 121410]|uniref:Glycoside hydrolase family 89 protein n=1 Tax=Saccharata proteae CBS 121410 TaxID=1314787 RepID=A0A9P4HYR8_9PEZI|nr:glycoside hydrolase family 89 protein [Saccharata proteae CBS 121410]
MRVSALVALLATSAASIAAPHCDATGTQGLVDLVSRRMPAHVGSFEFCLRSSGSGLRDGSAAPENGSSQGYDAYVVSSTAGGRVRVESETLSGLASGLHRYLADVVHVDIWWFIGSRLHVAPAKLPVLNTSLSGQSVVKWRYHFNTVTFSYTTVFWTWEDWELELDWLALRGVNLPLAWVGQEKILIEVFRDLGLLDNEIASFLSGPAFQAWNRFGNIQGSWGGYGSLPQSWINGQSELQKKIVCRMVELGMTPVLPSFTGFVPRAITRVLPNATVVNGTRWNNFPAQYTNVTFLSPVDPTFAALQKNFIDKQTAAYGNITHIYTLDQYNENTPSSSDPAYLQKISHSTWQSLKAADPDAVWMMQGWLFFVNSAFWTEARIQAYLSGVSNNEDMLILDLFSESEPQWQRTRSYDGKPWIWCQLHDYGGTMGLYGQVENVTVNSMQALAESDHLVGFGNTMEAQEGNEVVYSLLLDQAWSSTPIDIERYFHSWATRRYNDVSCNKTSTPHLLPQPLYTASSLLSTTAYNNTNLTSAAAVPKSLLELRPALSGLANRTTAQFPITTINYPPEAMVEVWSLMRNASRLRPDLLDHPAYQHDMVDVTRQVLANAFVVLYQGFVDALAANASAGSLQAKGADMLGLICSLDAVLRMERGFGLEGWMSAAREWAEVDAGSAAAVALFEFDARNLVTLWGPDGELSDYASREWSGLVGGYYGERWRTFVDEVLEERLDGFEMGWQRSGNGNGDGMQRSLEDVLEELTWKWPRIFG